MAKTLNIAVRKRIKNLCEERGITLHALSIAAEMEWSTLSSLMKNPEGDVYIETLEKVARGFQMSLIEFLDFHYERWPEDAEDEVKSSGMNVYYYPKCENAMMMEDKKMEEPYSNSK